MSSLQNTDRRISSGQEWGEDRGLGNGAQNTKLLIAQANTVSFDSVFRYYGMDLNEYNRKICCPFKFHDDNSPSFNYYPDTNSFNCFGCKSGGGPVNFVALYEDISKSSSAKKLIASFESEEVDPLIFIKSKEREELQLKFSGMVRGFLQINQTKEALEFMDRITHSFDFITQNHKVDLDGLKLIIDKLEKQIKGY